MQPMPAIEVQHSVRARLTRFARLACAALVLLSVGAGLVHAARQPAPPAQAVKDFAAAKDSGDAAAILALYDQYAAQDDKAGALALLYAGLGEVVLGDCDDQQARPFLDAAQAALLSMTDKAARKEIYKAVRKHLDWRVRVMVLNIARLRYHEERRAEKAILIAINDHVDAVAIRAVEISIELEIKRAVPKLIKLVMDKWGQHVGVGAAKAKVALEQITGHTKPTAWYEWVSQNL